MFSSVAFSPFNVAQPPPLPFYHPRETPTPINLSRPLPPLPSLRQSPSCFLSLGLLFREWNKQDGTTYDPSCRAPSTLFDHTFCTSLRKETQGPLLSSRTLTPSSDPPSLIALSPCPQLLHSAPFPISHNYPEQRTWMGHSVI